MKTDLYTKRILTVLAVVLMVIAFKYFPLEASADSYTFKDYRQFEGAVKDVVNRSQTKVLKAPGTGKKRVDNKSVELERKTRAY